MNEDYVIRTAGVTAQPGMLSQEQCMQPQPWPRPWPRLPRVHQQKSDIKFHADLLAHGNQDPKNFHKDLDKQRRKFLWAGDGDITGGKCKVAWTKVSMPTLNEGMGLVNLEMFGQVLRLRWLWFAWEDRECPWKVMQLPLDHHNMGLFNAATTVRLGNGRVGAPSGCRDGSKGRRRHSYSQPSINIAREKIEL